MQNTNGLPETEFAPEVAACPDCGERRLDALDLDLENESVDCRTCNLRYYLPGSLKRMVYDAVDERLEFLRKEGRLSA